MVPDSRFWILDSEFPIIDSQIPKVLSIFSSLSLPSAHNCLGSACETSAGRPATLAAILAHRHNPAALLAFAAQPAVRAHAAAAALLAYAAHPAMRAYVAAAALLASGAHPAMRAYAAAAALLALAAHPAMRA